MRNWEKSKKDSRRQDERELVHHNQDHKKKKLKPTEKSKYRIKSYFDDEE